MKFRPVGAELFHADRRTDRHDKGLFSQYCERAKKKNTLAYERVFCHVTIRLPLSTTTQNLPSLFLLGKKSLFHLNFWMLSNLSTVIMALPSLRSTKQFALAIPMYVIEMRIKFFFLSFSVLRGTHKLLGWGGATVHTTVYAGSGLEPMVVCTVTCDTFSAKDQLHQHYQLNQH
jgi:hypothetical protein